jgi:dihydrofolate reductase
MSKVIVSAAVSVDGFIADPEGGVGPLFDWYFNGEQELEVAPHRYVPRGGYRPRPRSAELLRRTWSQIGATVIGRRLFDLTDGWWGKPAVGDQVFVVTHRDPGDWPDRYPEAPFRFVGDLAEAVAQARAAAGERDVSVTAGDLAGQAVRAGLVDEIEMDVVPVVFGAGIRFFGDHEVGVTMLDDPEVIEGDRVTHLRYRVRRERA